MTPKPVLQLRERITAWYGLPPSTSLLAQFQAQSIRLNNPRRPERLLIGRHPGVALFSKGTLRASADVVGAFTGTLPVGRDGGGNEYLIEVHPKRSPLFVLDTSGELRAVRTKGSAPPSSRSKVMARWRRAAWLVKLITGFHARSEPWSGPMKDELDLLYLTWQASLNRSADEALLLGQAVAARAGVVRDAALFLRSPKAEALRKQLSPAGAPPRSKVHDAMVEALRQVELPRSYRPYVRAASEAPKTHVLNHLLGALEKRQAWSAMLAVANAQLALEKGFFMPWLQKGIALKNLGRAEEAIVAVQKAKRIHPRHPVVVQTLSELLEGRSKERREPP